MKPILTKGWVGPIGFKRGQLGWHSGSIAWVQLSQGFLFLPIKFAQNCSRQLDYPFKIYLDTCHANFRFWWDHAHFRFRLGHALILNLFGNLTTHITILCIIAISFIVLSCANAVVSETFFYTQTQTNKKKLLHCTKEIAPMQKKHFNQLGTFQIGFRQFGLF